MAADFFIPEAWTRRGLQRFVILFFMELSTRRVEIGGIASNANEMWMRQIGRNLTDARSLQIYADPFSGHYGIAISITEQSDIVLLFAETNEDLEKRFPPMLRTA